MFWILFHQEKSIKCQLQKQILLTTIFSLYNPLYTDYFPLMPAGASPFPVAEKDQNATAAPDAMKVSGLANVVRAAPAKAEES